jgi:hypothetical protein
MANPVREKRAWLTRDREAESKETAAFEATVAAAKDTAAKSGEMLETAKASLTDYQRWLQEQNAAVQADRARHELWLERQREYRETLAKRELARRRRQLMLQRMMRAVAQTVTDTALYVRALFLRFVAALVAGLTFLVRQALKALSWLGGLFLSGFAWSAGKFHALLRPVIPALMGAVFWTKTKAMTLAPRLSALVAGAGRQARATAQRAFARGERPAEGRFQPVVSPAGAENRVSLGSRIREFDLSQMLIIAGTLLLVCGGLMLGGGLILRAGTPTPEQEAAPAIAWWFEEPSQPLAHRVIFTLSGTPQSFRINGLLIHGENKSDDPLAAVESVVKPDMPRPELKLAVSVDKPAPQAEDSSNTEARMAPAMTSNVIPPHAPFKLAFPIPAEAGGHQDGLTPEEFFEAYGGLTLKIRYQVNGRQKVFIHYLSPETLRAQLDEVRAMGS